MSQTTYLTFVEGTSSKFWRAEVEGVTLKTQWGKIGTAGQSQEKTFTTDAEALAAFDKQKAEKVKKGYSEIEAGTAETTTAASPATTIPVAKAAPATKKAVSSPAPAPAAPPEIIEPRIHLKPEEYARIGWKTTPPPKPRPDVKPFNLEECLARIDTMVGPKEGSFWGWHWDKLLPAHDLSREEAHFLLEVLQAASNTNKHTDLKKHLAGKVFDGNWSLQAAGQLYTHWNGMPRLFARALWALQGPDALLTFLTTSNDWQTSPVCDALETDLFPILTVTEREEFRDTVATYLLKAQPAPHWLLWLGAILGADPQLVRQIVAGWPDGSGKPEYMYTHYTNPHTRIIVGLGEKDAIVHELRRTKAWPSSIDDVKAVLAATEFASLETIAEGICEATNKAEAEKLAKAMLLAEGPETAIALATLAISSKVPHLAREWWEAHPTFAIRGLATICGEKSKRGEVALEWLRGLQRRGEEARIEAALAPLPEAMATVREKVLDAAEEKSYPLIDEASMPDWLRETLGGKLSIPDAPAEANPPP
ncbi:MAG: WGR domain-containing protein [Armatimonas sp.]